MDEPTDCRTGLTMVIVDLPRGWACDQGSYNRELSRFDPSCFLVCSNLYPWSWNAQIRSYLEPSSSPHPVYSRISHLVPASCLFCLNNFRVRDCYFLVPLPIRLDCSRLILVPFIISFNQSPVSLFLYFYLSTADVVSSLLVSPELPTQLSARCMLMANRLRDARKILCPFLPSRVSWSSSRPVEPRAGRLPLAYVRFRPTSPFSGSQVLT